MPPHHPPRNQPRTRPQNPTIAAILLCSTVLVSLAPAMLALDPETPITVDQAASAGPGWLLRFLGLEPLLELYGEQAGSRWNAPMSSARVNPVSLNRNGEVRLFETADWPRPGIDHGLGPYAGTRFDRFSLFHNSFALWSNDALGPGWTHSGDIRVHTWREAMGVSRAAVLWGNGNVQLFERQSGGYVSLDPYRDVLSREKGQFVLTLKNGTVVRFEKENNSKSVVSSLEDPNGNASTFAYDPMGRLARITDPHGRTLELAYSPEGKLVQVVYALGAAVRVCDLTHDGGELRMVERPPAAALARESSRYEYDENANLVRDIDAVGNTITHHYDQHRLIELVMPSGAAERLAQLTAEVLQHIDPRGVERTLTFDPRHRLVEIVDGLGGVRRLEYADPDYEHGPSLLRTPLGRTTEIDYDARGNVIALRDPGGNLTEYRHDTDNRLTAVVRPLVAGNAEPGQTTFGYDPAGNLTSVRESLGGGAGLETSFTYDALGNRLSRTDPGGATTTYSYDAFGNRTSLIDPLLRPFIAQHSSAEETYLFNRPSQVTTGNGDIDLRYDELGRTVRKATTTQTVDYVYDILGHLAAMADGTGLTQWTYDADGSVVAQDKSADPTATPMPPSYAVTYDYFPNGLLREVALPGEGRTIQYGYDGNNRLRSITDGAIVQTRSYDADGRLETMVNSNGSTETFSYGPVAREHITQTDGAGTVVDLTVVLDAAGNVKSIIEQDGSRTDYQHDLVGNLIAEQRSDAGGTLQSYYYQWLRDANGDRYQELEVVGPTSDVTTLTFDLDGGPTSASSSAGSHSFDYDANGNMNVVVSPTGGVALFARDAENLTAFFKGDGRTVRTLHDGLGRKVAQSLSDGAGEVVQQYFYDGSYPLGESTDSGTTRDITPDPAGGMVAQTIDGTPLLMHYDYHGFLSHFTDGAGNQVPASPRPRNGYGDIVGGPSTQPSPYVGDRLVDAGAGLLALGGSEYYPPLARTAAEFSGHVHGRPGASSFHAVPGFDGGPRVATATPTRLIGVDVGFLPAYDDRYEIERALLRAVLQNYRAGGQRYVTPVDEPARLPMGRARALFD